MSFELGEFRFTLRSSPGHSPDSIVCLIHGEDILFAADTVMPIPYFVDGSFDDLERSLGLLLDQEYENIVQGHGDIILRGEAPGKIASDLEYLRRLSEAVGNALEDGQQNIEDSITLEACGKSQVLLNGVVQQLHQHNIRALVNDGQNDSSLPLDQDACYDYEGHPQWQQKNLI
jgi:glyoxylase-like metal-dependent hydrolase (beta-lactamase superfamily II)